MRKEYHLLAYNAVNSAECQPTIRRNVLPPSSGSKKSVKAGGMKRSAGFLLGLFLDPEDGGNMFLRNVS
jgi:hypothetical protein